MKAAIIYKGKYGATRQYAEWLAEELQLPVFTSDNIDSQKIAAYDFFVIGSSVYVGKWLLRDWLKKHISIFKNKKLFLFVVCATSAYEKPKQEGIIINNFPINFLKEANIFFLPGRVIIKKLSWKYRWILRIGASLEKDPAKKKAMLTDFDNVKKQNIADLVKAVRIFMYGETVSLQTEMTF